jgi:hypothetical protein
MARGQEVKAARLHLPFLFLETDHTKPALPPAPYLSSMFRVPMLLVAAASATAPFARAQPAPSNADVLGRLAAACVAGVPAPASFYLDVPAPYLRSPLGSAFGAVGRTVRADSTAGARVAVRVERAGLTYARAGRGRLRRSATLRLRLRVVDDTGRVVYDDACTRDAADVIAARQRLALEDPLWPETVGTGPPPSRLRRALEVGVVAGAVVTSTLLLFSLRSR